MPGQWADSQRRTTLPKDWQPRIRPAILTRDQHQCTWLGDIDHDGRPADYIHAAYEGTAHDLTDRCDAQATDVDHIGRAEDHRPQNLRSLCPRHHNHRSSRQGIQARAERQRQRTRPRRPHPGLRTIPDLGGISRS